MRAARLLRWQMAFFLPAALFVLVLASLGTARGISSNDPFRAIALTVTKPESPPVCCLKALTPLEPLDDEVLLSFEDWKKKQQAAQREESPRETVGSNQTLGQKNAANTGSHNVDAPPDSNVSTDVSGSVQPPDVAPHFRVPITDRFNYAHTDCSARVHTSHRSAKSPSSILSSKKDRYMLSPCNSGREKQFVVVELCDDIRIDTVQLANFEFFSGVFKDFTVSVAKTYSVDPDGWIFAGTYRAKNVRGVQSFHPPTSLGDFYRFIRIDFLSHYGNEYYCPISLLRVYGLTHLEEWKWDIWEAESRAKLEKAGGPAVQVLSNSLEDTLTSRDKDSTAMATRATTIPQEPEDPSLTTAPGAASSNSVPSPSTQSPIIELSSIPSITSQSSQDSSRSQTSLSSPTSTQVSSSPVPISHTSVLESPLKIHEPIISTFSDAHSQVQSPNTSNISSSTIIPTSHPSIPSAYTYTSSIVQAQSPPPPPPPVPPTGESIYRTIMNRLTAVENNQTLYMKYVEQQNGAMRDVIKRLGEDVGRLEGITRAQGMAFQKSVSDWEKQRYQLQMEYKDILRRMEMLSHEIILEKRLGVAQLCLLLAVLIFLGLTRGSRGNEGFEVGFSSSKSVKAGGLREWGRRHLSWTGDRSGLAAKSSEITYRAGQKKENDGWNRSHDRMREKSNTKTPIKRPKPLALGPSTMDNILRANDAENSRLPFPSSEPPLPHSTTGITNRPRTRTISHSRSREGSGTATPLYSAPISGSVHGTNRRAAFQRPVTPTSRTHFVFRTPQTIQRSHSFARSTTPTVSAGGPVKGLAPLPMSQTSSWGGTIGVVPRSAKNWARSAHLHDVNSAKKRQEQERIEFARSRRKSNCESTETDVDDDDVFLGSLKTGPPCEVLDLSDTSSGRSLLLGLAQDTELHKTGPLVLPAEDDPWVDTDSASVDDGTAEVFDLSPVM